MLLSINDIEDCQSGWCVYVICKR